MIHTNLKNPIRRNTELPYTEFRYPIISRKFLPEPNFHNPISFHETLDRRKSVRSFNELSIDHLNSLLWYSARTIQSTSPSNGVRWEHRPSPSAGGRHPIDLFVINTNKENFSVYLYQNFYHSLAELQIDKDKMLQLLAEAKNILSYDNGTIIWLGAQFDRTLARYEHGESLVWKDAGALISLISLVAASLNLNCCSLGITGEPYFSQSFQTNQIIGVGGIYIGSSY